MRIPLILTFVIPRSPAHTHIHTEVVNSKNWRIGMFAVISLESSYFRIKLLGVFRGYSFSSHYSSYVQKAFLYNYLSCILPNYQGSSRLVFVSIYQTKIKINEVNLLKIMLGIFIGNNINWEPQKVLVGFNLIFCLVSIDENSVLWFGGGFKINKKRSWEQCLKNILNDNPPGKSFFFFFAKIISFRISHFLIKSTVQDFKLPSKGFVLIKKQIYRSPALIYSKHKIIL